MLDMTLFQAAQVYGFIDLIAAVKRGEYTVSRGKIVDIFLPGVKVNCRTLNEMEASDFILEATNQAPSVCRKLMTEQRAPYWYPLGRSIKIYYKVGGTFR